MRVPVVTGMFEAAMFPGAQVDVPRVRLEASVGAREKLIDLPLDQRDPHSPRVAVVHRAAAEGVERQTIFFYGNGMTLLETPPIRRVFGSAGAGVTTVDYPGYGGSPGEPTERGCHRAARATLDLVESTLGGDPGEVDVVGWSMGSAVALRLAARRKVRRLVLMSPFTGVAPWVAGRVPAAGGVLERTAISRLGPFAPPRSLDGITCPTLLISGDADTLTPPSMAQDLHRRLSPRAGLMTVPGAGHNDLFSHEEVWHRLLGFLQAP